MLGASGSTPSAAQIMEIRILRLIRSKSRSEKQIARKLQVDPIVLSPVITDLMLKGYLEVFRRRKFFFFSRELFAITIEGISFLESRSTLHGILAAIRSRASDALDEILANSAAFRFVAGATRTAYRFAKTTL